MSNEFSRYVAVISKRLWLIGLLVIATVGTILVLGFSAPPAYEARVRLRVLAVEPEAVTLFTQSPALVGREQIIATREEFFAFLASRSVAWKTIADLGLEMDADTLLRHLDLRDEGDFVAVIATAGHPELAEKIATTHVNHALQAYREFRLVPVGQSVQFVNSQVETQQKALADAQDALLKFKLANNLESLPAEISALQNEIRQLRLNRDTAAIDEQQAVAVHDTYRAMAEQALQQSVSALAPGAGAATPITGTLNVVGAAAGLEDEERQQLARVLREEALRYNNLTVEQQVRIGEAKAAQARYAQMIVQREAELSSLIGLHADYDNLQAAVDRAQDAYSFLADKAVEARLKENQGLTAGYLQIVEPARIPTNPAPSQTVRLALVGGILAVLAGIVLAFVLEFAGNLRSSRGPVQSPRTRPGSQ
jgi:uncharacterized protein involved in exopolysaccharide biosynthesis